MGLRVLNDEEISKVLHKTSIRKLPYPNIAQAQFRADIKRFIELLEKGYQGNNAFGASFFVVDLESLKQLVGEE